MDPMVGVGSSIASCGAISDSSDNAALLDFCFLCSRQFFHDNLDNYGTERLKDEDVLETFFEELGPVDRALLQCCPSCKNLCKTLTRTKEALSSLIDEITNLLLRSKKVSYLLSKSRIVSRLFQSSNISLPPCEVSSSYLQQPLSQLNFPRPISSNSNCFPTQFNLRLDSSNLSDEDQMDLSLAYSNTSSITKKRNCKHLAKLYKTASSQELTTPTCNSAFSCIYNDSIMNSVCDNACDISQDIKVENEHESSFKTTDIETQTTSSANILKQGLSPKNSAPTKSKCKEKTHLSLRSNSQKLSKLNPIVGTTDINDRLCRSSLSADDTRNKVGDGDSLVSKRKVTTKALAATSSKVKKKPIKLRRKPFQNEKSLKIHSNEFKCDLCCKTFSQNIGLKRHLRIHSKKFQFQCDLCGKQFLHHTSFTAHKLIHIGVRNFGCPECDQTFLQKSNLQRHLKTHKGEKPHRCSKCNRSFTERYNLLAHMKSHENNSMYQCSECLKTYTRKFKLKQHMKQIHNMLL